MVNNIEELKALINDYSEILDKAGSVAGGWNFTPTSIEYDDDWLIVYGEEYCRGYTDPESYSFPISWMFMDPEQLAKAKEEKARADKIARQEWEKQKAEREAAEAEAKDKAEYERLRAKYGN